MIEKKAYRGATIQRWVVIILERQQRFSQSACENMVQGLRQSAEAMGALPNLLSFIFVC
jgi:eukaryotic translation initiation factor 2C